MGNLKDELEELQKKKLEQEIEKNSLFLGNGNNQQKENSKKQKSDFDGFKRTNLSKTEITKFNNVIDKEVKKLDEQIEKTEIDTEEYQNLLSTRARLLNQRIEKEPSKLVEHSLRYGLPVLGSVIATVAYLGMQDPSQEGRTWFSGIKDMIQKFRN